jgi:hypothetical protein
MAATASMWRTSRQLRADGRYRLAVTVHDSYNLFPMREHRRAFGATRGASR